MKLHDVKFQMEYNDQERGTRSLYYKAPAWILYDLKETEKKMAQYQDANSAILCAKFEDKTMQIKECSVIIAPAKNDIPYEWIKLELSGELIGELIYIYEKQNVNQSIH